MKRVQTMTDPAAALGLTTESARYSANPELNATQNRACPIGYEMQVWRPPSAAASLGEPSRCCRPFNLESLDPACPKGND
jgi:hypothetical protein